MLSYSNQQIVASVAFNGLHGVITQKIHVELITT
jgi:hypothetical protein